MNVTLRDRTKVVSRFERKFKRGKPNECWEWLANRHKQGYGFFRLGRRMELSHRVAYCIYKKNPGERKVLHICDNTCCVNPKHLKLGTQADNMKDASRKGRMGHPPEVVDLVRRLLAKGVREKDIVRSAGISRGSVYRIRYNRAHRYD